MLDPGDSGPETTEGDGTTGGSSNDTIDELTDGLVNGGGTQPTSNPSGLPGVPDVDDVTDGVTDDLTSNTKP